VDTHKQNTDTISQAKPLNAGAKGGGRKALTHTERVTNIEVNLSEGVECVQYLNRTGQN